MRVLVLCGIILAQAGPAAGEQTDQRQQAGRRLWTDGGLLSQQEVALKDITVGVFLSRQHWACLMKLKQVHNTARQAPDESHGQGQKAGVYTHRDKERWSVKV